MKKIYCVALLLLTTIACKDNTKTKENKTAAEPIGVENVEKSIVAVVEKLVVAPEANAV